MSLLKLDKNFAFFGLFLLLLFTYFRENFLLEINATLAAESYNRSYIYWMSDFFRKMTHSELLRWKWGITIVFSVVMTFITVGSIHVWFRSANYLKTTITVYFLAFGLVSLIALIGYLTNFFEQVYPMLRKILGIVQSPLPFFTFFALFYSKNKNK